jgi:hypothetical protein
MMKGKNLKKIWLVTLLVLTALATGCRVGTQPESVAADTPPSPQQLPFVDGKPLAVPVNTAIYVRLQQQLSSATAQPGQNFSAVLDEPLIVDGQTLAPSGAAVTGTVVAARESGHLNNAGYLRITLTSILLNGKAVPLQTNSMFVSGGSYKKRNLAFIGGGVGGGTLLGALVSGSKGAVAGSAAGATAGTAAAYATGKNEVGFVAERQLGFRLTQPLNMN